MGVVEIEQPKETRLVLGPELAGTLMTPDEFHGHGSYAPLVIASPTAVVATTGGSHGGRSQSPPPQ